MFPILHLVPCICKSKLYERSDSTQKASNFGVFSGPYFPVFGLNTKIFRLNLRVQSEYGKIQAEENSNFGHSNFSRSGSNSHEIIIQEFGRLLILRKLRPLLETAYSSSCNQRLLFLEF